MPASGPFGKWTMADLAEELNIGQPWMRQSLSEKGCPKLVPDLRAGLLNLYGDDTAERWLAAYRAWRAAEPERKAEKRAENAARVRGESEAEATRLRDQMRVQQAMQTAIAREVAEEAAREADMLALSARMQGRK
jgi:hypothetical protein